MKTRLILTAAVVVLWGVSYRVYGLVRGGMEGAAAAGQLKDSAAQYGASRFVLQGGVFSLVSAAAVVILIVVWAGAFKSRNKSIKAVLIDKK